jgi:hypothetical protein
MKLKLFIIPFILAGAVIPLLFLGMTSYMQVPEHFNSGLGLRIEQAMLMLWPSSIFEMATDGLHSGDPNLYLIPLLSITLNILLYVFIGTFIWLGLRKHKAFFIIPILFPAIIWWQLLWLT